MDECELVVAFFSGELEPFPCCGTSALALVMAAGLLLLLLVWDDKWPLMESSTLGTKKMTMVNTTVRTTKSILITNEAIGFVLESTTTGTPRMSASASLHSKSVRVSQVR